MPVQQVPFDYWLVVAGLSLLSGMCFGRAIVLRLTGRHRS